MALQEIGPIIPADQNLVWLNKNTIKTVAANSRRASNGALIYQQTPLVSGIPILIGTLGGWLPRSEYEALRNHSQNTTAPFVVKINGDTLNVIWDHTGDAAVTGDDLFTQAGGYSLVTNVTLRFLTVA